MSKNRSPGAPFGLGSDRAGNLDCCASGSEPRCSKSPSPKQASPAGQSFRVSEYVTLNPSLAPVATDFLSMMTRNAVIRQGPAAFDCPKTTACVHEAGHCIVYAIQGIVPERVSIKCRRRQGREYWGGVTMGPPDPPIDKHSDVRGDYEIASLKCAGFIAEMIFGDEEFRMASSLDEMLLVKLIATTIAGKNGDDLGYICPEIFARTMMRLQNHASVLLDIADELRRYERLLMRRLAVWLQPVLESEKAINTPWGQPPGPEFERVIAQIKARK